MGPFMGHAVFTDPGRWFQENLEEDEGTLNAEDIELLREVPIGGGELCGASPPVAILEDVNMAVCQNL